ncbi:MAG: DEAD/DEAH box helicase [Gemmatimonadetes bacterium]|nr:DEAD/DEAH box helicase [Gemmatimonadota bacterium]
MGRVEVMLGGLGLSVSQFFEALSDRELRQFLDPGVLAVLDAIFGGQIAGDDLRRVARMLVDVHMLLGDEEGRRLVLSHIPDGKLAELEGRIGRSIRPADRSNWTEVEIGQIREFFDLVEERIAPPPVPSTDTISPEYGLFDHQRNVVRKLTPLLAQDERRAVLHLPTGVGKTRTAMHVVVDWLCTYEPSVVVWLASGQELLEQAVLEFKEAWSHLGTRPLQLGTMWGDQMPDLDSFSDGFLAVGLAKGWAVISRTDPDWASRLSSRVRLVIFDEAHQSIARTYRRIAEELTLDFRSSLLGLTATPGRTWNDIDEDGKLAEFFSGNKVSLDVPGNNPIEYLIDNGFLARPIFRTLLSKSGINIGNDELARISGALEIPEEIVASLSMSEQYVTAVLEGVIELLGKGHQRVLVFAATVDHARVLTAILIARSIQSHVVTGSTPIRLRQQAIRIFKSDQEEPIVLVNFGVLTTGFDAPKASAVVIARPTQSLVLYSQMVGRAIRGPKAGGTKTCEILTVVDPSLPGFGDVAEAFLNWEDVWQ